MERESRRGRKTKRERQRYRGKDFLSRKGNVCRGKFIVYGIPIHKFEGERVGQRESRKEIAIDREENIFFFK